MTPIHLSVGSVPIRQPALPLTRTDWGIFLWLASRRSMSIERTLVECFSADNRDADLLLLAQKNRFVGNVCTRDGDFWDWEFDVVVRLGLVRVYLP